MTWSYQNIVDLKVKYGIEAPIERTLRITAERKIIETTLLAQIEKGNNTIKSIAKEIHEPESFVRTALNGLAGKGIISIDKSKKPHKLFLKRPQRTRQSL
jgi:predicted transcriptional regulator